MEQLGSWAYDSDEFEEIVSLTDAGTALHLLKSVFFLNGPKKKHWNSVRHPRDRNGRWAHTFGTKDESIGRDPFGGSGGGGSHRIYGTSKSTTLPTKDGVPDAKATVNPGDRVYQTAAGSHVIVKPDGSGTYVGRDGKQIQLNSKGVDSHLGAKGTTKNPPKLVDHQPGIQVNASSDAEAEKILQQHESIDKKYASKNPNPGKYTPKHASSEPVKSDVPSKDNANDFSALDLKPGDELRRNSQNNDQTLILHDDGSSTLFDAASGKATNNNLNKTQGILLGNPDVADAIAGKKTWSSLDPKGLASSQKTMDSRWPIIHKEPMQNTTFEHSQHGPINANYSESKNIVAKEHPSGIAVKNTHTGATLLHKKDGTVSKFPGSGNDFNALPDAKAKESIKKANDATHHNDTLGGTTPTNIGSDPTQKNSYRQQQRDSAKGIKQESLGGVDSTGNLTLPTGAGKSDTIVIETEAELNVIMSTFKQLGITQINGVPLAEYFNLKGKKN